MTRGASCRTSSRSSAPLARRCRRSSRTPMAKWPCARSAGSETMPKTLSGGWRAFPEADDTGPSEAHRTHLPRRRSHQVRCQASAQAPLQIACCPPLRHLERQSGEDVSASGTLDARHGWCRERRSDLGNPPMGQAASFRALTKVGRFLSGLEYSSLRNSPHG